MKEELVRLLREDETVQDALLFAVEEARKRAKEREEERRHLFGRCLQVLGAGKPLLMRSIYAERSYSLWPRDEPEPALVTNLIALVQQAYPERFRLSEAISEKSAPHPAEVPL